MSSWAAARRSSVAESAGAGGTSKAKAAARSERRVPLRNLTNIVGARAHAAKSEKSSLPSTVSDVKEGSLASLRNLNTERVSVPKPTSGHFDQAIPHRGSTLQKELVCCPYPPTTVPSLGHHDCSPGLSDNSMSTGDAMSTSDSTEGLVIDFLDNGDSLVESSLQHLADDKLHISDSRDAADMASNWTYHGSNSVEIDYIVDIDNNHEDPQLCATLAFDIYKNLHVAEVIDSFTGHISANMLMYYA